MDYYPQTYTYSIDNELYIKPLTTYFDEIKRRKCKVDITDISNYDSLIMRLITNVSVFTSNNNNNSKSPNNQQHKTKFNHVIYPREDLTFLINNAIQMEKEIIGNNLIDVDTTNNNNGNSNSNVYSSNNNNNNNHIRRDYEETIFILKKEIANLNSQKTILEKNVNELNALITLFDTKYASFSTTFFDENDNTDTTIVNNSHFQKKTLSPSSSKQIMQLYLNKLFNECIELWKKFSYQPLLNESIERSYEILVYLSKIRDRQIKKLIRDNEMNGNVDIKEETRKKNCEIVELLTKNEFYQCKLDENEIILNDLKGRIKHLIEDNNELYMQNSKLKNLIEFK